MMEKTGRLPRWLKPMNRVNMAIQRLGLPIGPVHVLSVPGRTSGVLRSTPVTPLIVDGHRYIIGGQTDADWVKNARASGWGMLATGRNRQRVTLTELPIEERAPILRAFPRLVPGGVPFFRQLYGLPKDPAGLPEAFAALAPRCSVFRIDTAHGEG
ncbi:MAG: nitroreductase/quinone reductase family protein [Chloroflexota bacterium]|nr:nitroreductase/quinone reductase family protein [Chloroflexota bacterium]